MFEAVIGVIIILVILLVWYFQFREKPEAPPAEVSTPPVTASENAARTIANAEAPKGVFSSASATTVLPAAILPTTSADVAKQPSAINTLVTTQTTVAATTVPTVPTVPTPIVPTVPTTPVTSSLPKAPAASAATLSSMLPTYTFHQGMTFGGNDLANTGLTDNVPKLAAWCDANATCKGFTTDAWMKSTIVPQDKWYKWSDVATKGLYVKK